MSAERNVQLGNSLPRANRVLNGFFAGERNYTKRLFLAQYLSIERCSSRFVTSLGRPSEFSSTLASAVSKKVL